MLLISMTPSPPFLRPAAQCVDSSLSEGHTDPKQLRKLKQQQLQQKFRQQMEAKRLDQDQGHTAPSGLGESCSREEHLAGTVLDQQGAPEQLVL